MDIKTKYILNIFLEQHGHLAFQGILWKPWMSPMRRYLRLSNKQQTSIQYIHKLLFRHI